MVAAKQTLADLEAEPKRRASRRKEIPGLLGAARDEIAKITQELLAAEQQQDGSPEALATKTLRLARRQRLEQEIHALEQETAAYDATPELLRQQRDLAAARLALAEQAEKQWRDIVNRRTKEQAEDETKTALEEARQVEETLPALRPLADATHAYAVESETASGEAMAASTDLQKVQATLDQVTQEYARTRERVDAAGLSYAIGSLLRSQRTSLPDVETIERKRRARQSEVRSTQLRLFELDDRRSDMANLEGKVQAEMRQLGPLPEGMTAAKVEPLVRDLLTKQRDQLDALIRNYDKYFETLVDLDEAEQLLVRKTQDYADYIDERVFWIGSASPLRLSDAALGRRRAGLVGVARQLDRLVAAGVLDARSQPALNLLLILLLAVLVWKQRRLRALLGKTAELARQRSLCRITPTVEALLATVLIAAVWPAVMLYVGWRLAGSLSASEFVVAVVGRSDARRRGVAAAGTGPAGLPSRRPGRGTFRLADGRSGDGSDESSVVHPERAAAGAGGGHVAGAGQPKLRELAGADLLDRRVLADGRGVPPRLAALGRFFPAGAGPRRRFLAVPAAPRVVSTGRPESSGAGVALRPRLQLHGPPAFRPVAADALRAAGLGDRRAPFCCGGCWWCDVGWPSRGSDRRPRRSQPTPRPRRRRRASRRSIWPRSASRPAA